MLQKCAKVIGVSKLMYGCWIANGTSAPAPPCPVHLSLFCSHKPCSIWGPWPGIQAGGWGESTCICIVFNKILTFLNWIPLHKFAANSNKSQQTKNQITTKVWEQWNFPHSTHTHTLTHLYFCSPGWSKLSSGIHIHVRLNMLYNSK